MLMLLCLPTVYWGVDYSIPINEQGSSSESISMGTGLFSTNPNGFFDSDAIVQEKRLALSSYYSSSMGDYETVVYALGWRVSEWMIRLGYSQAGTSAIDKTTTTGLDEEFIPDGTYSYVNAHMKGGISKYFGDQVIIGIGINYYKTTLATYEGSGYSSSLAMRFMSNKSQVAIGLNNFLSSPVEFNDGQETLPLDIVLGFQFRPLNRLYISPTVKTISSDVAYESSYLKSIGFSILPLEWVSINLSYFENYAGIAVNTNVGAGLSIRFNHLGVQYGFKTSDYSESSQQHFISMDLKL